MDPQVHRVPSGVWPLGHDMHHGSASRLLEKGTNLCAPSGNWLSHPCGDAGTGRTVCPQNRGEQTRQRPLGLWLGLNPRARCQAEGAEANHTRLHRLPGDLWEAQWDSEPTNGLQGGEGPCGGPSALPGFFLIALFPGQFPVHSKTEGKAHPSSPTISSPIRAVCSLQLGHAPVARGHRSRASSLVVVSIPWVWTNAQRHVFTVTSSHGDCPPPRTPSGLLSASPPAPRPPPVSCLAPPPDVMQLESDCVQALQKRCFHLAMFV